VKVIRKATILAALVPATIAAGPALAHSVGNSTAGFTGGFLHPLSGLDHLLAMVSVGIWGAELGAPAIWLFPIAFPLIMAFGGALGIIGVPLPAGELLIALSVVVLGTFVASARQLPITAALAVVGIFAMRMAMPMASSCRAPPTPLSSRQDLSLRPGCCTWRGS